VSLLTRPHTDRHRRDTVICTRCPPRPALTQSVSACSQSPASASHRRRRRRCFYSSEAKRAPVRQATRRAAAAASVQLLNPRRPLQLTIPPNHVPDNSLTRSSQKQRIRSASPNTCPRNLLHLSRTSAPRTYPIPDPTVN